MQVVKEAARYLESARLVNAWLGDSSQRNARYDVSTSFQDIRRVGVVGLTLL